MSTTFTTLQQDILQQNLIHEVLRNIFLSEIHDRNFNIDSSEMEILILRMKNVPGKL